MAGRRRADDGPGPGLSERQQRILDFIQAYAERHGLFSPLDVGAPTAAVNVYVHDIDTHYHRAESEGAQIVTPLEDMFWGDRRYEALDLEGHRWHFAERLPEIRA